MRDIFHFEIFVVSSLEWAIFVKGCLITIWLLYIYLVDHFDSLIISVFYEFGISWRKPIIIRLLVALSG